MKIIDGKKIAAKIKEDLAIKVQEIKQKHKTEFNIPTVDNFIVTSDIRHMHPARHTSDKSLLQLACRARMCVKLSRFRVPPTPAFHRGWHYRSAQHNTATV